MTVHFRGTGEFKSSFADDPMTDEIVSGAFSNFIFSHHHRTFSQTCLDQRCADLVISSPQSVRVRQLSVRVRRISIKWVRVRMKLHLLKQQDQQFSRDVKLVTDH